MVSRKNLIRKTIEDILGGINSDLRKAITDRYTAILLCRTSEIDDEILKAWLESLKINTGIDGLEQAVIDSADL